METYIISLNTALYILAILIIGKIAFSGIKEKERVIEQINTLVFKIFLPAMIFQNVYSTDLQTAFDGKLLLYTMAVFFGIWFILLFLCPKYIRDRRTCGTFIQGSVRTNSIIFGIPLLTGLFPGQDLGCAMILTAVTTVGFNIMGVITLEVFRGNQPSLTKILRNLIRNPMVIACSLAILLLLLDVSLPSFATKTLGGLASIASPMGLLLIGGRIELQHMTRDREMCAFLLLRLFLIPAIGVAGAILCGWRGLELCTVMIVMACPTSISAYSMAQVMDSDALFAAKQVGFSSVLGAGTICLWAIILKAFGLY